MKKKEKSLKKGIRPAHSMTAKLHYIKCWFLDLDALNNKAPGCLNVGLSLVMDSLTDQ